RRLPVAEDVERRGDAWVDVLPAWHTPDLVVAARRHEGAGSQILCGNERVEVVVSEAQIERQSLHRPLILAVDSQVDLQALDERDGLRVLGHRQGPPVEERVTHNAGSDTCPRTVIVIPGVVPGFLCGEAHL